jgi:hypothetical protein
MSAALKLVPDFEPWELREWGLPDINPAPRFDYWSTPGATGQAQLLIGDTPGNWYECIACEPEPSYQTSFDIYSLSNPVATSPWANLSVTRQFGQRPRGRPFFTCKRFTNFQVSVTSESVSTALVSVHLLSSLAENDAGQDDSAIPDEGVYAPQWPRKILFSETVEFRISELPRREPSVFVDDGFLTVIDDE